MPHDVLPFRAPATLSTSLSAEIEADLRQLDSLALTLNSSPREPKATNNATLLDDADRVEPEDDSFPFTLHSGSREPKTPDNDSLLNKAVGVESEDDSSETSDEEDGGAKSFEVNAPPKPRKISEKKRADFAEFELWVEQNQSRLSKRKLVLDQDDSVRRMIQDFETKRIITSPRDYQLELFEIAKNQNTIAVLDTGSGKTLIAALLLRWTIHNEIEDRSQGHPKRIAFFLVDKVALVFQQHTVIDCNLDYPVAKLCGEILDSSPDKKDLWQKAFEENMAVVCTAAVLYDCLSRSYIRMDQINLLVFDEAHHTKKNHPYARIIKDFYLDAKEGGKRPRILGMTASPVDAQVDPRMAAAQLEALLHSQIATAADPATLQQTLCKPKEEIVVEYDRIPRDWETELHQALSPIIETHFLFKKPLEYARTAAADLGPWLADRYWQLFFGEEESIKLGSKTERTLLMESAVDEYRDRKVKEVQDGSRVVANHDFLRPTLDTTSLSSKVLQLVKYLRSQFAPSGSNCDNDRRCIVFVKQRTTAMLLADLVQQPEIKIPGLEVGILIGGGRSDTEFYNRKVGFRDQVRTVLKFKSGELNCIFATSVGEEGLDIPDCNVIIRFDLCDTLIQYIQSRGRARQEQSVYVHMVEKGNKKHRSKIIQNKMHEDTLRKFCSAMPEERKLTGNNLNMDYLLRKEKNQQQYTVPETGAKLNFKQSLITLATFVASLPHPPDVNLTPEYTVTVVSGGFQCEVLLPSTSPVKTAIGRVYSSKAVAKCSAAFEMCLALLRGKYLDKHLQTVFRKQVSAMRNARLAISSKKKGEYDMRIKPDIWSVRGVPTELHATALTLVNPGALGRASFPLLLLTRQPIAQIGLFALFFGTNSSSEVRCIPLPGTLKFNEDCSPEAIAAFTLKIFSDVFSKDYDATPAELPFFLAPTREAHDFDLPATKGIKYIIDWDTVKFVQKTERIEYGFDQEPDDFFTDKYVVDPWDGSRKFVLQRRCHHLKPTDTVPEGVVPPGHRAWRVSCQTHHILNYSISLWSRSRSRMTFRHEQPVVEAQLMPIRRNLLDDNIPDEDLQPKKCFLILEPLRISPLPVRVVAMAYNLPAIIHHIDSTLIALDACKLLGLDIRPDLALEAFTKDSDNSDEHDVEKINFQAGMGKNYERLEFLGDTFLKMATTISIYTQMPDKDECEYHVERMLMLCNRNLFNNAVEIKLEEYIRSASFNGRTWYPEGLTLTKGKRTNNNVKHALADKSIADVCEAVIGAAYLTAQNENSLDLAVQAVTAVVKDKNHSMKEYSDYYAAYKKPKWMLEPTNAIQVDMAERFRERLGYSFKSPRLLRCAFQHPTYPSIYEKLPSYQNLEFLGDSLLDMVCVDHLFRRFPGADPQWLTEHKMAMVSNQFLGCVAVELGFHKAITFCSPAIQNEIMEYVFKLEEALVEAKEQAVLAGKTEEQFSKDYWVHCAKPPKCLPDVLEAYLGAMFVDSEYDFGTVRAFFDRHILPYFEDIHLYDTFANKHPVTFLANLMQLRFHCSDWRLLVKDLNEGEDGEAALLGRGGAPQVVCAIRIHGQTVAHAVAESGRYSKIAAAKKAMNMLEDMDDEEFKGKYGCQCGEGKPSGNENVEQMDEALLHGTAI
ncbi:hypothetical protein B0H66DRAFT_557274 [Apodospora peruviana]|uniref:Dicer-like protein 1 n=1 Tax=Apodospora peruviana TaxID=516989 RepID=A0AAE0I4W2_9PEZI|nr:hypothetical protein B0H66DRAFT_557274 [Apodospora peruviana]